MAIIDETIGRFFGQPSSDLDGAVLEIDTAIFNAGLLVTTIRDQMRCGPCDVATHDRVAAGLEALLAYLGQTGPIIDRLEALATAQRHSTAQAERG